MDPNMHDLHMLIISKNHKEILKWRHDHPLPDIPRKEGYQPSTINADKMAEMLLPEKMEVILYKVCISFYFIYKFYTLFCSLSHLRINFPVKMYLLL